MKVLCLINKGENGGPIRPMRKGPPSGKYSDLATLFSSEPKIGVARDIWKYKTKGLNKFDLVIFENTFYNTWQKHFVEMADNIKTKTLVWMGAVDRFLRFVKPESLGVISQALEKVDYIATLNGEDVKTWKTWAPQAHVFHFPIWYDLEQQRDLFPPPKPDPDFVMLCVHSSIWLEPHARRGDAQSFMVFKRLKERYPDLKGVTFMMKRHRAVYDQTRESIRAMGINDLELCVHSSFWFQMMSRAFCGIDMTQTKIQGKWNIHHAIAGVPIISTDCTDAQRRLFPDLTVSAWDAEGAIEKYESLRAGGINREDVLENSEKALQFFSRKSALKRIKREMDIEI